MQRHKLGQGEFKRSESKHCDYNNVKCKHFHMTVECLVWEEEKKKKAWSRCHEKHYRFLVMETWSINVGRSLRERKIVELLPLRFRDEKSFVQHCASRWNLQLYRVARNSLMSAEIPRELFFLLSCKFQKKLASIFKSSWEEFLRRNCQVYMNLYFLTHCCDCLIFIAGRKDTFLILVFISNWI